MITEVKEQPSLVIGIITRDNSQGLQRLLESIQQQNEPSVVEQVRIIVVDNADERSAETVARDSGWAGPFPVQYVHEPGGGIPAARNRCVIEAIEQNACCLIFIDDDETVGNGWLEALVRRWSVSRGGVVMGPVIGVVPEDAPEWARRSRVFDKRFTPRRDGTIRRGYTYNTLVDRSVLDRLGATFHPAFSEIGSSDHDYFERARQLGVETYWADDAIAYECVTRDRLRVGWLFQRGWRIGSGCAVSLQLRQGRALCLFYCLGLAGYNAAAGIAALAAGLRSGRPGWPFAVRRLGAALGFLVGPFGLRRYEYRSARVRDIT